MYTMNVLVVYFSRDGHTKDVAENIAKKMNADIECVTEEGVDRNGIIGWLKSGYDGFRKNKSKIVNTKFDCKNYDRIYIGSPVWAFNIAPAIRTYLDTEDLSQKEIGLFGTMDGSGAEKLFKDMKTYLSKSKIIGELIVLSSKVNTSEDEINNFLEK